MPVLVDTNVLVRLSDLASQDHAACAELLDPSNVARHELCCCAQVMIEYWSVATRPANLNGLGLSPAEAAADLDGLRKLLPCLLEPPDIGDQWLRLVLAAGVIGKQAHDARLVALMEAHQVRRIVTLNAVHFARYSTIEPMSPPALLAGS